MATKKRAGRATPEQIAEMVDAIDAYKDTHPGASATAAHRAIGSKVPVKNYYAAKRVRGKAKNLTGTDIPLSAIPERHSPGISLYKRKKIAADTQTQVAIDLIKMGLKILEAK